MSDKCEHKSKIIDRETILTIQPPHYKYQCQVCLETGFILCSEADKPACEVDHRQLYWAAQMVLRIVSPMVLRIVSPNLPDDCEYINPPCPKCGADLEKEVKSD